MALLAGCNTGDSGGVLNLGNDRVAKAQEQQVLQSELTGFCPQVTLREGTAFFTTYEKGGDGDQTRAIYQAAITDTTRACTRPNGMLVMNIAVAGRVVPGPKANGKTVTLPIRIAIVEGEAVLYSQIQQFQVTVNAGQAATQFVFNDPNPSVPLSSAKKIIVYVGFDEGPPKPKKVEG
ncbi:MAG: hypothetical protein WCC66_13960 [Rhizobiaceae bacterium]